MTIEVKPRQPTGGSPALREVIVRPAGHRRETLGLLAALAVILAVMALRVALLGDTRDRQFLQPYQRLDTVLQPDEVTVYQGLLAAVPDVIALRDQEGQWPESVLLEIEMVPPFAPQLLPKTLRSYQWIGYDGGPWIDYVGGDPTGAGKTTFMLRVIDVQSEYHPEPHPGVDYDPDFRIASQVWMFPAADRAYPGERALEAGWWWLVSPNDPLLKNQPQNPVNPKADRSKLTASAPQ